MSILVRRDSQSVEGDLLERDAEIRRLYQGEHWKVGTIATQLGLHHETVESVLGLRRRRKSAKPRKPRPWAVEPYLEFIRETLKDYPTLTGTRVFEMIKGRGYKRGVAQVCRAIVHWKLRPEPPREAFLSLRLLPGEQAQVDWAHLGDVVVDGVRRRVWALLFTLGYSRDAVVYFSHTQATEGVVAGHLHAFRTWGGVPRQMVYDNMKTAVLERRGSAIRFHPVLLEMAGHFAFEPVACRPRKATDKGRVERRVRHLRSSFLAARTMRDLADFRREFATWRTEILHARRWPSDHSKTVAEALESERQVLLPLPQGLRAFEILETASVGKQPYVRFDSNRYTVPPSCVCRHVTLSVEPERIRVIDGGAVVAEHRRCWGRGRTIEDDRHLEALRAQRRRAAARAGRFRLFDAVPEAEHLLGMLAARQEPLGGHTRLLLRLLDQHGASVLGAAVKEAIERDTPQAASVRWLVERAARAPRPATSPVDLPDRPDVRDQPIPTPDLETYDVLNRKNRP